MAVVDAHQLDQERVHLGGLAGRTGQTRLVVSQEVQGTQTLGGRQQVGGYQTVQPEQHPEAFSLIGGNEVGAGLGERDIVLIQVFEQLVEFEWFQHRDISIL